ncbi:metallophosphoesterase [Kiritimatiellota bacterium B12222]|nr:metallophosphoesterase [Kiritimatiellota bacterium B12222]
MNPRLATLVTRLREKSHYQKADYVQLADLIGEEQLTRRLEAQLRLYTNQAKSGRPWMRKLYRKSIVTGLWMIGHYAKAKQLARKPEWVEQEWFFDHLPAAFDGYRILQLSDFHFDFIPELPEIVKTLIAPHRFDCCALTGDFRGETTGPYEESLQQLRKTRPYLGEQVYAVLGNHDNVELLLDFPEMNIQALMNEAVILERGGEKIRLAGVDDPHFYQAHECDFLKEDDAPFTVLFAHSPESWREAEEVGVALQLSGHTHGGQLCLPGGIPVLAHLEDCPREMIKGRWQVGGLQGYTSRGIGASTLDLRLNCPPEITVHILRCKN